ncbi:unnamed protein product [Lampetra fluviatilis]
MAKGKREKATDVGEVTRKKKKRTLDPDAERKADEKRARRKTRGKELPAEQFLRQCIVPLLSKISIKTHFSKCDRTDRQQ